MNLSLLGSVIPLVFFVSCQAWNQGGTHKGGWSKLPPEPRLRYSNLDPTEGHPDFPPESTGPAASEAANMNDQRDTSQQGTEPSGVSFFAGVQNNKRPNPSELGSPSVARVPTLGQKNQVMNLGKETSSMHQNDAYSLSKQADVASWINLGSNMDANSEKQQSTQEPTANQDPPIGPKINGDPSVTDKYFFIDQQPVVGMHEPHGRDNQLSAQSIIGNPGDKLQWKTSMQALQYDAQIPVAASNTGAYLDSICSNFLGSQHDVIEPRDRLGEQVSEEHLSSLQEANLIVDPMIKQNDKKNAYGNQKSKAHGPTLNPELPIVEDFGDMQRQEIDSQATEQETQVSDTDSDLHRLPVSEVEASEESLVPADIKSCIAKSNHQLYHSDSFQAPQDIPQVKKGPPTAAFSTGFYLDIISSIRQPDEPVVSEFRNQFAKPKHILENQPSSLHKIFTEEGPPAQTNGMGVYSNMQSEVREAFLIKESYSVVDAIKEPIPNDLPSLQQMTVNGGTIITNKPNITNFSRERTLLKKEMQELSAQINEERRKMKKWKEDNKDTLPEVENFSLGTKMGTINIQQSLLQDVAITEPPVAEHLHVGASATDKVEASTMEKAAKSYIYRPPPVRQHTGKSHSARTQKQRSPKLPQPSTALSNKATNPISYLEKMSIYNRPLASTATVKQNEIAKSEHLLGKQNYPALKSSLPRASLDVESPEPAMRELVIEGVGSSEKEQIMSQNRKQVSQDAPISNPRPVLGNDTLVDELVQSKKSTNDEKTVTEFSTPEFPIHENGTFAENLPLSMHRTVAESSVVGVSKPMPALTDDKILAEDPSLYKQSIVGDVAVTGPSEPESAIKENDPLVAEPKLSQDPAVAEGTLAEALEPKRAVEDDQVLMEATSLSARSSIAEGAVPGLLETAAEEKDTLLQESPLSIDPTFTEGLADGVSGRKLVSEDSEMEGTALSGSIAAGGASEAESATEVCCIIAEGPTLSSNPTITKGSGNELYKPQAVTDDHNDPVEESSKIDKSIVEAVVMPNLIKSEYTAEDTDTLAEAPTLSKGPTDAKGPADEVSKPNCFSEESDGLAEVPAIPDKSIVPRIPTSRISEAESSNESEGSLAVESSLSKDLTGLEGSVAEPSKVKPLRENGRPLEEGPTQPANSSVLGSLGTGVSQSVENAPLAEKSTLRKDQAVSGILVVELSKSFMDVDKPLMESSAVWDWIRTWTRFQKMEKAKTGPDEPKEKGIKYKIDTMDCYV